MFLQQGDVKIISIDKLPEGKKILRKQRGYVIAEGEVTNHAHVIDEEITMIEKNGIIYIGCETDVIITHEEHGHIKIPAGNYEIGIVKEYDHFLEESRNVAD
jgi:hypothetical protein